MTTNPLALRAAFIAGIVWETFRPLWPYALGAFACGALWGLAIYVAPVQP